MKKYKILFTDLDGTLIDTITGNTFPKGIWDMQFNFAVLDRIKELNPDYIFIVSNQGGIEKNLIEEDHFCDKINYIITSLKEYINKEAIDYEYCISNDKENVYRKPNTEMLAKLLRNYEINYTSKLEMLMIGDASGKPGQFSDSDKQTAINFGIDYIDVEDFINEQID